jgi:hypothetical protein
MKNALILAAAFVLGGSHSALASGSARVLSCRLQGLIPLQGFQLKANPSPVFLTQEHPEMTYVEMSGGVWENRRIYLGLEAKVVNGVSLLGVGIPEDSKIFSATVFSPELEVRFTSLLQAPFGGFVHCEPVSVPYLFLHSKAAQLAVRSSPFTAEKFVLSPVTRSFDDLLAQSCLLGSNEAAISGLQASAHFSRKSTLRTEGQGLAFQVDRIAGCRHFNEDDFYCDDPVIEPNGTTVVVPPCS